MPNLPEALRPGGARISTKSPSTYFWLIEYFLDGDPQGLYVSLVDNRFLRTTDWSKALRFNSRRNCEATICCLRDWGVIGKGVVVKATEHSEYPGRVLVIRRDANIVFNEYGDPRFWIEVDIDVISDAISGSQLRGNRKSDMELELVLHQVRGGKIMGIPFKFKLED